jgi:Tfp pilus assembly protein PilN
VLAQKEVNQAKIAIDSQNTLLKIMRETENITNSQIWYDKISMTPSSLTLTAYAASLPAFGQYLMAVQNDPLFTSVRVGKIESSTANGAQLQFDISMEVKK